MTKKLKDINDKNTENISFLSDLMNKTFIISDVKFDEIDKIGTYAYLTINNQKYKTASSVLIDQLKRYEEVILNEGLEVTLRSKKSNESKNYYQIFE